MLALEIAAEVPVITRRQAGLRSRTLIFFRIAEGTRYIHLGYSD